MGTNSITKLRLGRDPLLEDAAKYYGMNYVVRYLAYAGMGSIFGLPATNGYMEPPLILRKLLYILRADDWDSSQR